MKKIAPFLCLLLLVISCNQMDSDSQEKILTLNQQLQEAKNTIEQLSSDETGFVHTVFFWLNDDVTDEQKSDFAKNGLTNLVKIPLIYKSYIGPPAITPREVVDNSYDFALICHFKNKEDQDSYQKDPIHLKFIDDYKHLWEKVQVYDNLILK